MKFAKLHPLGRTALVSAAFLALTAPAALADFMGGGALYGFSSACRAAGWGTGGVPVTARYVPSEIFVGQRSQLALGFATGTEQISVAASVTFAPRTASVAAVGRFIWDQYGVYATAPRIRVLERRITERVNASGAATIPNARTVMLRARILNFNNIPGCTVEFAGTMRRP